MNAVICFIVIFINALFKLCCRVFAAFYFSFAAARRNPKIIHLMLNIACFRSSYVQVSSPIDIDKNSRCQLPKGSHHGGRPAPPQALCKSSNAVRSLPYCARGYLAAIGPSPAQLRFHRWKQPRLHHSSRWHIVDDGDVHEHHFCTTVEALLGHASAERARKVLASYKRGAMARHVRALCGSPFDGDRDRGRDAGWTGGDPISKWQVQVWFVRLILVRACELCTRDAHGLCVLQY